MSTNGPTKPNSMRLALGALALLLALSLAPAAVAQGGAWGPYKWKETDDDVTGPSSFSNEDTTHRDAQRAIGEIEDQLADIESATNDPETQRLLDILDFLQSVRDLLRGELDALVNAITSNVSSIQSAVRSIIQAINDFLSGIKNELIGFIQLLDERFGAIKDKAGDVVDSLPSIDWGLLNPFETLPALKDSLVAVKDLLDEVLGLADIPGEVARRLARIKAAFDRTMSSIGTNLSAIGTAVSNLVTATASAANNLVQGMREKSAEITAKYPDLGSPLNPEIDIAMRATAEVFAQPFDGLSQVPDPTGTLQRMSTQMASFIRALGGLESYLNTLARAAAELATPSNMAKLGQIPSLGEDVEVKGPNGKLTLGSVAGAVEELNIGRAMPGSSSNPSHGEKAIRLVQFQDKMTILAGEWGQLMQDHLDSSPTDRNREEAAEIGRLDLSLSPVALTLDGVGIALDIASLTLDIVGAGSGSGLGAVNVAGIVIGYISITVGGISYGLDYFDRMLSIAGLVITVSDMGDEIDAFAETAPKALGLRKRFLETLIEGNPSGVSLMKTDTYEKR